MSWYEKPDEIPFEVLFQYRVKIFQAEFVPESWALYGIAMASVVLRLYVSPAVPCAVDRPIANDDATA
jgi:hypothetical protein